jgi:glycosyltransferase involved in cell wall biosynthesis
LSINKAWITWEDHRRSKELCKEFNARYIIPTFHNRLRDIPLFRYIVLTTKTVIALTKYKPKIVFAQNPSIILAAVIILTNKIHNYKVVIDRHSNFKLHKNKRLLKWKIFEFISDYTIRNAELTIVTNKYLHNLVKLKGGVPYILEDKIPDDCTIKPIKLKGDANVVYICGYNEDEPIIELIEASRNLKKSWKVYITGDFTKIKTKYIFKNLPPNIVFTGFLTEENYMRLLKSSDIIVVLTKQEYTLTCGAYEGLSVGKPMVLSNTTTIKEYFNKGVIYVDPTVESIYNGIVRANYDKEKLTKEIDMLKIFLRADWMKKYEKLKNIIFNYFN